MLLKFQEEEIDDQKDLSNFSRQYLQNWFSSRYEFERLAQVNRDHSTICLCDHDEISSPSILTIGKRSSQIMLFGDEWAQELDHSKKTPSTDLEKKAAKGYQRVFDGVPYVSKTTLWYKRNNRTMFFTYERVIVPVRLKHFSDAICLYMGYVLDHTVQ